jgi:hypothetical protein
MTCGEVLSVREAFRDGLVSADGELGDLVASKR